MWDIDFISKVNYIELVANAISDFASNLLSHDFNGDSEDIFDPIKLILAKESYNMSWE